MKTLFTKTGVPILLVILSISLSAQTNDPIPFSGKWVSQKFEAAGIAKLVYTDKTPAIRFLERVEIAYAASKLRIDFDGWFETQDSNGKFIRKLNKSSTTHYTDGRVETNLVDGAEIRSATKFKRNEISIEIFGPKGKTAVRKLKFKLSEDGKTLSVERISDGTYYMTPDRSVPEFVIPFKVPFDGKATYVREN
jgi:hypothetical protein